jgi:iron uptake system component EfeO
VHTRLFLAAVAMSGMALAGCAAKDSASPKSTTPAGAQVSVTATDTACELSVAEGTTGATTFAVTNNGTKVTELYVYNKDGSVLAEVENISPGLQRELSVDLTEPGTYKLACKPGGVGDGVPADFTVKG